MDYRPLYHYLPPKGWMNDPNGPIFYDGYYHLFYQYNPYSDSWGSIHWGHARSRDLVRWEHLPVALAPSTHRGELHCFSGCVVINGDTPTALYTSVGDDERNARTGAEQWMATSGDGMLTWEKGSAPILTQEIHGGETIRDWRDPFVWREGDRWRMLLGGERDGYGVITAYSSDDLLHWQYDGVFFEDKRHHFLECPNLLAFGDRHVLLYSPDSAVRYQVGRVVDGRFVADSEGLLDHSGFWGYYAPNTLLGDPKRRYLTWGWLREDARGSLSIPGWQGIQSLPRVLGLTEDGRLLQSPAQELEQLREGHPVRLERDNFQGQVESGIVGNALELHVEATLDSDDQLLIHVLQSPDGRERTTIRFVAATATLSLEKGKSSLHDGAGRHFQFATVPDFDGHLSLRIFLDVSVIEIFAGQGTAMSGRVYPALPESQGVRLEGSAKELSARFWHMKRVNEQ